MDGDSGGPGFLRLEGQGFKILAVASSIKPSFGRFSRETSHYAFVAPALPWLQAELGFDPQAGVQDNSQALVCALKNRLAQTGGEYPNLSSRTLQSLAESLGVALTCAGPR